MKKSQFLSACICCVLAGIALGMGLARVTGLGNGQERATNGKKTATASRDIKPVETGRAAGDGEFSDLAGLKTPEQWRGYIERWIAAGCPPKLQKNLPRIDRGAVAQRMIMTLKDTHAEAAWVLARADNIQVRPTFFGQIMQAIV